MPSALDSDNKWSTALLFTGFSINPPGLPRPWKKRDASVRFLLVCGVLGADWLDAGLLFKSTHAA